MIFDASDIPVTDPWATPNLPIPPTVFPTPRQTLASLWHLARVSPPGQGGKVLPPPQMDETSPVTTL